VIKIVDYGVGNLRSVQKAFEKVGYTASLVSKPEELQGCDLLVLPGVGAFDRAVYNLKQRKLWSPIAEHLKAGRPYLGICLGLQLLFEGSEEGRESGFAQFPGKVIEFKNITPVPHMGWNETVWVNEGVNLSPAAVEIPCYYYVHSYFPVPADPDLTAAYSDYGGRFCSAVRRGNVMGVQFHPEKSQFAGLNFLKKYCEGVLNYD